MKKERDKIGTNSKRSQWHLPVNWPFTNDKIDMKYLFPELVLDMSSIQLFTDLLFKPLINSIRVWEVPFK